MDKNYDVSMSIHFFDVINLRIEVLKLLSISQSITFPHFPILIVLDSFGKKFFIDIDVISVVSFRLEISKRTVTQLPLSKHFLLSTSTIR